MAEPHRDVWITGIGIVSCLGEGLDAHWDKLNNAKPAADTRQFAPNIVHRIGSIDFDKQIPKKGDQRQMEMWQRIGTYAAGLALDQAGVKGNAELLGRMDMIVAAGGGERDVPVDFDILTRMPTTPSPERYLNERLMSDLRPTLFLAQLSNLLAGNISVVHGVTGSSRTFMGEESAGADAVRIALARIQAGQSDITLVGGAYNGEREDLFLLYGFGHFNLKGELRPVWERAPEGGFALGSLGAFLVIESAEHAKARGAKPIARLADAIADRARRTPGAVAAKLDAMWDQVSTRNKIDGKSAAVISGASGAEPATSEERAFLAKHADLAVRAPGTHVGHGIDAQFIVNIALAALVIKHGKLYAPSDTKGFERPAPEAITQVVVTGVGHWWGESLAVLEAVR